MDVFPAPIVRVQQWRQALVILQDVPKRDQQLEGSQTNAVGIYSFLSL